MRILAFLTIILTMVVTVDASTQEYSQTMSGMFEGVCTKGVIFFKYDPDHFEVLQIVSGVSIRERSTGKDNYITFFGNDGAGFALPDYWESYLSNHTDQSFMKSDTWKQMLSSDAAFDNTSEVHLIYSRDNNFFHVVLSKPVKTIRTVLKSMVLESEVFHGSPEQCK